MPERIAHEYGHIGRYHGALLKSLPNRQIREDAIQEGFRRALARPHLYDPARAFMPWVLTIMVNAGRDMKKRKDARAASLDYMNSDGEEIEPEHFFPSPELGPDQLLENAEEDRARMAAINELPPRGRRLMLLYVDDPEHQYNDLARYERISSGTIRSRLARARKIMREKFEPTDKHEPRR